MRIFLLLFITVPLAELYVLIEVGSGIGGLPTIGLCLLTALIGGLIIRWQGLNTLIRARRQMLVGEIPARHGLHGLLLAVAGVLLFTPGFITDTVGFLLLIPPLRSWLIDRMWKLPDDHDQGIIDVEIIEPKDRLP